MADYGDKPYGLRDVKVMTYGGATPVDLPVSRTLGYSERIRSGELSGDDALQSVVAFVEAIEWELEAGGISLEALEVITGRTATLSGTTPNRVLTMTTSAGDKFPYIVIYGKSLGEGDDDIHVKLWKCKCTSLEGSLKEGEFFITSCSGIGVDDGVNGISDIVQNETAANLPTS